MSLRWRILYPCILFAGSVIGLATGYLHVNLASVSTLADTGWGILTCSLLSVVVGGVSSTVCSRLAMFIERVSSKVDWSIASIVCTVLVAEGAGLLICAVPMGAGLLVGALGTAQVSRPDIVAVFAIALFAGSLWGSQIGVPLYNQIKSRVKSRIRNRKK